MEEEANKINEQILEDYLKGEKKPGEIIKYIDKRMSSEKNTKIFYRVIKPLTKGKIPVDEELATLFEWKAILGSEINSSKNDIYGDAYVAHCLRQEEMGTAKNPELFYPLLGYPKFGAPNNGGPWAVAQVGPPSGPGLDEGEVKSAEDTTEKVVERSATDNGVVFELSYNALQDGYRDTLTRGDWTSIHMGWLNGQRVVASIDEIIVTCSQHPNILNILDIIREGVSFPIILVEKVNWINSYFQERRGRFRESYVDQPGAVTVQTWWDNIQIDFRKIFRGIIEGLIFICINEYGCGNMFCTTFVTESDEGRILALKKDSSTCERYRSNLVDLMQEIIQPQLIAESEPFSVDLPVELMNFFNPPTPYDGVIPGHFWIDHPYYWNTKQKIAFSYRLHRVLKKEKLSNIMKTVMDADVKCPYIEWWETLTGRCKRIYEKANAEKEEAKDEKKEADKEKAPIPQNYVKLGVYESRVDIIRFYNAVYTHVNDEDYRQNDKAWSDAKIEEVLSSFFPRYYIDMVGYICQSIIGNRKRSSTQKKRMKERFKEIVDFRCNDEGFKVGGPTEKWSGQRSASYNVD